MKDLEWKDEYLLGIPAVDLQHKEIFDCFVAIAGGLPEDDRLRAEFALARLVGLLEMHFALEESMMRTLCYPHVERHIGDHRRYLVSMQDLARNSISTRGSISRETIKVAQGWMREHILVSDKHYIDFFSDPTRVTVSQEILPARTETERESNAARR